MASPYFSALSVLYGNLETNYWLQQHFIKDVYNVHYKIANVLCYTSGYRWLKELFNCFGHYFFLWGILAIIHSV